MQGPLTWTDFCIAGAGGRLAKLIAELPRERWSEKDAYGRTILHAACKGPDTAAVAMLLRSKAINVDAQADDHWTPLHYAAWYGRDRHVEMLIASGADTHAKSTPGYTAIEYAIPSNERSEDVKAAIETLLANGVRLRTLHRDYCMRRLLPEWFDLERGVLRCRSAVVALLRVKSIGRLWRWDKFLLRELAICVWATRRGEEWQE